jgi:hypothetical protein
MKSFPVRFHSYHETFSEYKRSLTTKKRDYLLFVLQVYPWYSGIQ